jgi:membrane protein YdbS with pleckstrin-like domain
LDSTQPADANGDFRSLDPRHIPADQIASLIFATVVAVGVIVGWVVIGLGRGFDTLWMILGAVGIVIIVALFVAAIFWPPLEYRHITWRLDDAGLEIRRGVLWRHRIAVPFARVQHADVSQGPLQRQFQLGTLTVHTAGTQNASVTLSGLAHTAAMQLRDELVRQRKAVDVV